MENSVTSGFAKTGQALADKAAGTAVRRSSKQIQSAGQQGLRAITDIASQARDAASNASESIVAYTKKNPLKALAIAAASGALLYAAVKALSPPRD